MGKYQIIKNGQDDYVLKYKDQEIKFNSNVDIVTELQRAEEIGKQKMIIDLARQGITINELVKEVKKDGKTYFDNSNKDEMMKSYINIERSNLFNKAIEKMVGKSLLDLSMEIGIETEEEANKLSLELGEILVGRFRKQQDKQ